MFSRYFMVSMGLLAAEYDAPKLLTALRDLRELTQVGGFDPKLYAVMRSDGTLREFVPGTRSWTGPVVHPLGAQAAAKPWTEQLAEQAAARAAAAVQ